jgi:hypothetical protein
MITTRCVNAVKVKQFESFQSKMSSFVKLKQLDMDKIVCAVRINLKIKFNSVSVPVDCVKSGPHLIKTHLSHKNVIFYYNYDLLWTILIKFTF